MTHVERCDRRVGVPVPFAETVAGVAAPAVRLQLRPPRSKFAAEQSYLVDTGSDVAVGLARPLRNWLQSTGLKPGRDDVEWGPRVRCETYEVLLRVSERWLPFTAYFPTGPFLDENLVGRQVLEHLPLCFRPAESLLKVSAAAK